MLLAVCFAARSGRFRRASWKVNRKLFFVFGASSSVSAVVPSSETPRITFTGRRAGLANIRKNAVSYTVVLKD